MEFLPAIEDLNEMLRDNDKLEVCSDDLSSDRYFLRNKETLETLGYFDKGDIETLLSDDRFFDPKKQVCKRIMALKALRTPVKELLAEPFRWHKEPEWEKHAIRMIELLKESEDELDFIPAVLMENSFRFCPFYAKLSRYNPTKGYRDGIDGRHSDRVLEMFGDCFTVVADAGSVRITSGATSINVPNGVGDGNIRCAVFPISEPFNADMMDTDYVMIEGPELNIMRYDCDLPEALKEDKTLGGVAKTISGRYMVYYYSGLVAFREM